MAFFSEWSDLPIGGVAEGMFFAELAKQACFRAIVQLTKIFVLFIMFFSTPVLRVDFYVFKNMNNTVIKSVVLTSTYNKFHNSFFLLTAETLERTRPRGLIALELIEYK